MHDALEGFEAVTMMVATSCVPTDLLSLPVVRLQCVLASIPDLILIKTGSTAKTFLYTVLGG